MNASASLKKYTAYACIYIIWGSTYLATDWAFELYPPFRMTGVRMIIASIILGLFSISAIKTLTIKECVNSVGFGILMVAFGAGGAMLSVVYLDTGLACLIVGFEPVLMVVLMYLLKSAPPGPYKLIGLALGISGMVILISQDSITNSDSAWIGILSLFISIVAWTIGSIYMKDAKIPSSSFLNTSIQLISSGAILYGIGLLLGEQPKGDSLFEFTPLCSFLYLVLFGSVIAHSAFNYLLIVDDPRKVASVTYVNPVIAMALGWFLNGEIITSNSLIAAFLLIISVLFILHEPKRMLNES